MIKGIHHVAVNVPDFEAGLAFYTGVLGMDLVWRQQLDGSREEIDATIGLPQVKADLAMLKIGDTHVELWCYENPKPQDRVAKASDYGYPHMALEVEQIEDVYARLSSLGMAFVGPVQHFGASAAIYGQDPFGNVIELYEVDTRR
jgi:glyoxylase I family protein